SVARLRARGRSSPTPPPISGPFQAQAQDWNMQSPCRDPPRSLSEKNLRPRGIVLSDISYRQEAARRRSALELGRVFRGTAFLPAPVVRLRDARRLSATSPRSQSAPVEDEPP